VFTPTGSHHRSCAGLPSPAAACPWPGAVGIEAGLRALTAGGPDAVRIEAPARPLGVTEGGFRGCFRAREALLTEMLDTWERAVTDDVIEQTESGGGDARGKPERLFTIASSTEETVIGVPVEPAVRDGARRDASVAGRLRRVDNPAHGLPARPLPSSAPTPTTWRSTVRWSSRCASAGTASRPNTARAAGPRSWRRPAAGCSGRGGAAGPRRRGPRPQDWGRLPWLAACLRRAFFLRRRFEDIPASCAEVNVHRRARRHPTSPRQPPFPRVRDSGAVLRDHGHGALPYPVRKAAGRPGARPAAARAR